MKYDLWNPTRATRIIYSGYKAQTEVRIVRGQTVFEVELADHVATALFTTNGMDDLAIAEHDPNRRNAMDAHSPVVLDGRFGIGDAIHQRGVVRELMRDHDVWLHTCHYRVYEDLVEKGLKLIFRQTNLHAQAKTIAREQLLFPHPPPPPPNAPRFSLAYDKGSIDRFGSILEAMAGNVGVKARPLDFSMPVRPEWRRNLKRFVFETGGKPIMIYRPIVLRREWNSANRNPDPVAYSAIFQAVRDGFFVISVGDFQPEREWIVGPEEDADVKLHNGELTFEDMAALWEEAAIVFCNAGFAPVLAQAVGTPSIVVYGGREDFATTQRAGEHLAPTLGIDMDVPCACHVERHDCGDKKIALEPAIQRAKDFAKDWDKNSEAKRRRAQGLESPQAHAAAARPQRTLIFATTYVDSGDREKLTRQWLDLHTALNPECDFLLVDSASPLPVLDQEWRDRFAAEPDRFRLFDFGNNVGHLSRRGRDGWGRAFCRGLDHAVDHGYDYAAHIEGNSLLRVPVRELVDRLARSGKAVGSIPVNGTTSAISPDWVETGLMVFSTSYLRGSGFTKRYNWPVREVRPTPELVVKNLVLPDLLMMGLRGLRGDKNQISAGNIVGLDLDWVTHCHSDIAVYSEFVRHNLEQTAPDRGANIAVIVGGSASVLDEVAATDAMIEGSGAQARYFVINDMIPRFERHCTAVSLHPVKLAGWLEERQRAGLSVPDDVWAHIRHAGVTRFTEDWRGSSGLFAVKVALGLGFRRIVLCGVPMDEKASHIVRKEPWPAAHQFMGGWKIHHDEIAPHVRSWSGWTEEMFGKPTAAFLGIGRKDEAA